MNDTIVAIVTALGSVGIVRLSGARSLAIAQKLFRTKSSWESHRVLYGRVVEPQSDRVVMKRLFYLWLVPGPTQRKMWWNFNATAAWWLGNRFCSYVLRRERG